MGAALTCLLLSSAAMGSVCSSPTLLAKGRGLEFKPQLCIPGSCCPSNQSREFKRKLKQGSLSPVESKNFLLSLAQGISCSCSWVESAGASLQGWARAGALGCAQPAQLGKSPVATLLLDTGHLLKSLPSLCWPRGGSAPVAGAPRGCKGAEPGAQARGRCFERWGESITVMPLGATRGQSPK